MIQVIDIYHHPLPRPGDEPLEVELDGGHRCIVEATRDGCWCVALMLPGVAAERIYRCDEEAIRDIVAAAGTIAAAAYRAGFLAGRAS